MENFTFYEVGGCVRDGLLGLSTKDVDFSVVAREGLFDTAEVAFAALEEQLLGEGFKVFESKPEFQTIRAQVPVGHPLRQRVRDADFVLARRDGPYSDGRRPDYVLPGTLEDDIFRRDFTVNALCRTVDGTLVDLVGGQEDLSQRLLRFVGDPLERVREDGLRVMRAFRFGVTKGFAFAAETEEVLLGAFAAEMLAGVAAERVREELVKMFRHNTLAALRLLGSLPVATQEAVFRDGLRLDATMAR
jgi:tRNA nucleotidyltransferase/poly(A) polymerase